jgi:serine/threonine protein kinase
MHPCILAPVAWSVKDDRGYLVMPRGKSITSSYKKDKISLSQIILDSCSAINFLNTRGIAHGDIKPDNMVYHDGRCKIIDMGLAVKGELFDGDYYITGELYTPEFRDIEYSIEQNNNIKCEIYALVTSYMFIVEDLQEGDIADSGQLCSYTHPRLDWLIQIALTPLNRRPSLRTVLRRAEKKYKSITERKIRYKEPTKIETCNNETYTISIWLIKYLSSELKAKTLFAALHLLNRVYEDVIEENEEKMLSCVVVMIASYLNKEQVNIQLYLQLLSIEEEEFTTIANNLIVSILQSTEGVLLTTTYWDYAQSKEDLYPLLQDLLSCTDNFKRSSNNSNKCIKVKDFLPSNMLFFSSKKGKLISSRLRSKEANSCILEVGANVDIIEHYWQKEEEPDIYLDIPLLLHNKEALKETTLSTAKNILSFLLHNKEDPLVIHTLNMICAFDWQNLGEVYLDIEKFHPFE